MVKKREKGEAEKGRQREKVTLLIWSKMLQKKRDCLSTNSSSPYCHIYPLVSHPPTLPYIQPYAWCRHKKHGYSNLHTLIPCMYSNTRIQQRKQRPAVWGELWFLSWRDKTNFYSTHQGDSYLLISHTKRDRTESLIMKGLQFSLVSKLSPKL